MRFPFWKDPSPAMQAWMEIDETWHEDQDSLSMIGDDLISATQFADSMAAERYGVKMSAEEDNRENNVLPFPDKSRKQSVEAGILIEGVPILHCHCGCQLFLITPVMLFCSECGCPIASVSSTRL